MDFNSLMGRFLVKALPPVTTVVPTQLIKPPTDFTITALVNGILRLVPIVVVIVFLGMIAYGGYVRLTSQGVPEKIEESGKILTSAVVGFLIIALSPLLINILAILIGLEPPFHL
jgi:hypothetical protein